MAGKTISAKSLHHEFITMRCVRGDKFTKLSVKVSCGVWLALNDISYTSLINMSLLYYIK